MNHRLTASPTAVAFETGHGRPSLVRALTFFGLVVTFQVGHLVEHIAVRIRGEALLGAAANTEETHLIFNGLIAVFALLLVRAFRRNPWVYPLVLVSALHGGEHAYIYEQYIRTGVANGPGLFGIGGVIGLVPLERLDLHNAYNGSELILLVLGFWNEVEVLLIPGEE